MRVLLLLLPTCHIQAHGGGGRYAESRSFHTNPYGSRCPIAPYISQSHLWLLLPPSTSRKSFQDGSYGHIGMPCGQGAMLTKLPLPTMPPILVGTYSLHVLCCPPPPTLDRVATRWQEARLVFSSDHLPEILRAPPIQWRAVLSDCCFFDEVCRVPCPYPGPFFTDDGNDPATLCVLSELGYTYERTIKLALVCDQNSTYYWNLHLILISRDGNWLASVSRDDTASFFSLDSIIRVIGYVHPERDSVENSVMFYQKTPGLEPHGHGQPSASHLGAAHDEEMRQLVDDGIENLIRGGGGLVHSAVLALPSRAEILGAP
ncbi:hypothetical protein QBC44DRAFT_304597 [Cladorrhinum sp. PSN332]|nr:hypothetical protein QBC44DRAFT_304597 [Cladorrhinum sp. PSN332]